MRYPVRYVVVLVTIGLFASLASPVRGATYQSFSQDAEVSLTFDFSQEAGPKTLPDKILTFFGLQKHSHHPEKVTVLDQQDRTWDTNASITDTFDAKPIVTMPPLTGLKPGVYTVKTDYVADGKRYTKEQDFAWGVLALNTNKSIYAPGEEAFLALAVLNEQGKTVCDASVHLDITDPSGKTTNLSTTNGLIKVNNPQCQAYEVHDKPDYFALYRVGGIGTYTMKLTAQTKNGTFSIEDSFGVKDGVPFVVERDLATRIYPPKVYPVEITIKANQDFEGVIVEAVPEEFGISEQYVILEGVKRLIGSQKIDAIASPSMASLQNDPKQIIWQIALKKGDTVTLGYNIKFPQRSPDFYLMGPLAFYETPKSSITLPFDIDKSKLVFQEERQWQIASDAIALVQSASNTVANSTTVSVGAGQGWAAPSANNLIVAACAARTNATMAMNTPTGMSSLANQTSGTTLGHRMFYKVAAGTGETTLTCSGPGANTRMIVEAYEYSGNATSSVLDASDDTKSGTGTSPTTNSINTSVDGDRIVASIATSGGSATSFGTWLNSYTEGSGGANGDATAGTGGTRLGLGSADLAQSSFGSTSTGATITGAGGSDPYLASIAAFKPQTITISGNAYTDEGGTPTVWTGAGNCDDSTTSVGLAINGSKIDDVACSSSDGSWQFTGQSVSAGDIITVYMNTGGGDKGVVYTKAADSSSNITGLKLTRNRVWIRSEQAANFTNANINQFDKSSNDTDIPADSNGTTLTVDSGVKLVIDSTKTFAPGGNVTVDSMEVLGTYSGSTETLTLTGSGTGSTCTADSGTVRPLCINGGTFTAPTNTQFSGSSDSAIQAATYTGLELNPTLTGSVLYTATGAITITGDFLIDPSAVTTQTLTIRLGGTTTVGSSTNINVAIGNSAQSILDTDASNNYSFTSPTIRIWSGGTLTANNSTITINGTSGTKFQRDAGGTFTSGGSTVNMQGDAALTLTAGSFTGSNAFYNLVINPTITQGRTYSFGSGAIDVNNNFTINPGTAANLLTVNMAADITVSGTTLISRTNSATSLLDTTASDYALTTGTLQIDAGGTLTPNDSTVSISEDFTNNGTFTAPTSNGTFTITGSGTSALTGATTFQNFTSTAAGKTITFGASTIFTFAGTVTLTGAAGNKITINSSDGSTQWDAHFTSAQTGSTYLSINNSGCDTGTETITLNGTSSNDGGNNDTSCWLFAGGGAAPQTQINGGTTLRGGTKIGQ